MSKRSRLRKRRALLSRRMGSRWDGRGRLNTLETPEKFVARIYGWDFGSGDSWTAYRKP
jgi:hypothetical protein